jgi:N-acetylmuramoyl-L-alanine amidase
VNSSNSKSLWSWTGYRVNAPALALAVLISIFPASVLATAPQIEHQERALRITLDPGHGGRDFGAQGPTGVLEKEVAINIARQLALKLESHYQITLTRSDDYRVDPYQRAAIANNAKSQLFISLHCGAGFMHATQGVSIYRYGSHKHTAPTKDPSPPPNVPSQAWDASQLRHKAESMKLATALKEQLEQIPGVEHCSVKSAPLPVLEGLDMPAILIEIGHITHPATEKKLSTTSHVEQLAEMIKAGIDRYMDEAISFNRP